VKDIWTTVRAPLTSSGVAGAITFGLSLLYGQSHLTRLILGGILLSTTYVTMLFFIFGQKTYYVDLLRQFVKRPAVEEEIVAAA
jgi:hypothetical protein